MFVSNVLPAKLYVPAGQLVGVADALAQAMPAGHAVQFVEPPDEMAPSVEYGHRIGTLDVDGQ